MEARSHQVTVLSLRDLRFSSGEALSLEGDGLWRIASGEVELISQDGLVLARLTRGDVLSSALSGRPRLGLRALSDVVLSPTEPANTELAALERRLAEQLDHRESELHERVLISRFVWSLLLIVCVYIALLGMPSLLARLPDSAWLSVPLQALFLFETVRFIRRSDLPRAWFGLTLDGWKPALIEGLGMASLLCGGLWAVRIASPTLLEEITGGPITWGALTIAGAAAVYAVFSFVQELVVRGGVESCFRLTLTGPMKVGGAALLANLLFALMHLHLSWTMAILSFAVGMVWSALYARHKTLVGVTASHLVVGLFIFFFIRAG